MLNLELETLILNRVGIVYDVRKQPNNLWDILP
jgi:hypothetical protein